LQIRLSSVSFVFIHNESAIAFPPSSPIKFPQRLSKVNVLLLHKALANASPTDSFNSLSLKLR